jgi:transposase-like protein
MNKLNKKLKYFLECYFHQNETIDNLEELIRDFKTESKASQEDFIEELCNIIERKNYGLASRTIKKYGKKTLNEEQTKRFIDHLYNRLLDKPTKLIIGDFKKNCRVVLCPVCSPILCVGKSFRVIEKATIIHNGIQIYICKPCKLVWLDENDIKAENAQDYKKFMKANGFKGLWKELKNVDVL